jgi:hypothetical protein
MLGITLTKEMGIEEFVENIPGVSEKSDGKK